MLLFGLVTVYAVIWFILNLVATTVSSIVFGLVTVCAVIGFRLNLVANTVSYVVIWTCQCVCCYRVHIELGSILLFISNNISSGLQHNYNDSIKFDYKWAIYIIVE